MTLAADPFSDFDRLVAQAVMKDLRGHDPEQDRDPEDQAALTDPVTLAAHLDPLYVVRNHLLVIGREMVGLRDRYIAYPETHKPPRLCLNTPPQVGKPVYSGTVILMGDGSRKRIDEIQVGEKVITHLGRPRTVLAVHRQGKLPCVEITTHSGRKTVAALDHPFLTPEGWVEAGKLTPNMTLALVPSPATTPRAQLLPEEARLLGYFVGDGSTGASAATSCSAGITSASPTVVEDIYRCAAKLGFGVRIGVPSKKPNASRTYNLSGGVRPWLVRHQLARKTSYTKRVPPEVFIASPEIIAEFVGAYWDCDGVVSSRGKDRSGQPRKDVIVELYSVSRELLADVQHLLLRLGIRSNIRTKIGSYNDAAHISYRLAAVTRDDVARFRDAIHLRHQKRAETLRGHFLYRTDFDRPLLSDPIVSVERTSDRECLCLTVEEDQTFTADDLVVHNTKTAVEWSAFWWLAQFPRHNVVVGSYNDDLAVARGKAIRKLVQTYGSRFGLAVEAGSGGMKDWRLTSGGGVRSVGVGSGITGFPGDAIFIDDPTKSRKEADSATYRQIVSDWYSADLLSRQSPGAPVCLIQTPWHPDDLRARVLAQDGRLEDGGIWRVVVMAAICADPTTDPLGRAAGEPLPHPKISPDDLAGMLAHWTGIRASVAARDWNALWQCDPKAPEGTLVSWDLLRQRRCFTSGSESGPCAPRKSVAVAVDPSGGGRDTAGVVGGYLGEDDRLYITHDRSGVMPSDQWARAACELAAEIDADKIVAETNFGGDLVTLAIRTAWQALRAEDPQRFGVISPRIVTVRAKRGKLLRAEPIAQQWSEDRVRTAVLLPEFEAEWAGWVVGGDSPGRIDASVYLAYELLPVPQSGETSAVGAGALASANLLPWGR